VEEEPFHFEQLEAVEQLHLKPQLLWEMQEELLWRLKRSENLMALRRVPSPLRRHMVQIQNQVEQINQLGNLLAYCA
jgi:hypothetical protein